MIRIGVSGDKWATPVHALARYTGENPEYALVLVAPEVRRT